ncbi:MAG: hypothetical protein Q9160_003292 [Pyrenula sp. 1 TL-2023]
MHGIKQESEHRHQHAIEDDKVVLAGNEEARPALCQLHATVNVSDNDEHSAGCPDPETKTEPGVLKETGLTHSIDDEEPQKDEDTHRCKLDGNTSKHDVGSVVFTCLVIGAGSNATAGSLNRDADEVEGNKDPEVEFR